MVGGIIPLRRATSSRSNGRLGQESAVNRSEEADHPSSSFHLPALDLTHIVVLD
jgi:hypothetical protein